ncbi:imidazole glycerol phosphate synthase subunit HisH [candidate division KSB1 bacterium]
MIAIIDYGAGNLANVKNALDFLYFKNRVVTGAVDLKNFDKIILPGVGAFGPAIKKLEEKCLDTAIKESVNKGIPFLGICLGMHLLFTESEENGIHKGLDLMKGKVKKFEVDLKIPHIGWNSLEFTRETKINRGLTSGRYAFFVHSYYCDPADDNVILAQTDYGIKFTSFVQKDNIFGMQFHPEKSQKTGLTLLKNFGDM